MIQLDNAHKYFDFIEFVSIKLNQGNLNKSFILISEY